MFYKTTVHSLVPGGVVDSRGKILTFIGNKVARVGDTIWTDGRVVFGHTPARGSPILLADGDEAIPIAMYDSDDDKIHYYIFKRKLFEIGESPVISSDRSVYYIDDERRTNFIRDAFMINDTKRSIYWQSGSIKNHVSTFQHDILINAVNEDKKGVIYSLQGNGYGVGVLSICKNKEFLFNINLNEDFKTNHNTSIYTGFIEDENNWAVIANIIDIDSKNILGKSVTYSYDVYIWLPEDYEALSSTVTSTEETTGTITDYSFKSYLVTPQKIELLYEVSAQRTVIPGIDIIVKDKHYGRYSTWFVEKEHIVIQGERNFSKKENIKSGTKIPLPDSYYYTINSYPRLSILGNSALAPLYMEITIFTPNGKKVLTDTFHVNSYITIKQITAKIFLLGVKVRQHGTLSVENKDFDLSITNELSVYLRNSLEDIKSFESIGGTFWVTNGEWEAISLDYLHNTSFVGNGLYLYSHENGLEKIAKGVCINQRLRPMPRGKIKSDNFTFVDLI